MVIAVVALSVVVVNLFLVCLACLSNPLRMRQVVGLRFSSAVLWTVVGALLGALLIVWALCSKKSK